MLASLCLICALAPAQSLLDHSTKIASTQGWYAPHSALPVYSWINSTELIFLSAERSRGVQGWNWVHWHRYNTKTKTSTLLEFLSRNADDADNFEVSPDGKRVLWDGSRNHQPYWFEAKLDGSEFKVWPRHDVPGVISNDEPCSYAFWARDSRSVMESENFFSPKGDYQVWERPIANPDIEKTFPRVEGSPFVMWAYPVTGGRMLGVSDNYLDGYKTDLCIWDPHHSGVVASHHLCLPRPYTISWFSGVSPDGRHLLWELHSKLGSEDVAIATTDLAGRNLRVIGALISKSVSSSFGGSAWVPGGKFVSFCYLGGLYVLPLPNAVGQN